MQDAPSSPSPTYGISRNRRASVSYGEAERAATALLKAGQRPTIDKLREALKGGAPDTIASALSRYWKDLGTRIEGDPASLTRLPAEVADLAETIWQRALILAADAAAQRVGVDQQQVEFFKRENELKAHSLSLKEKELDALLRSRERTIQELETHLRTAMGFVQQREETIRSLEARVAAAEASAEVSRQRLHRLVSRGGARPMRNRQPRRKTSRPVAKRSRQRVSRKARRG
jgi:hypothetical protein